MSKEPLWQMHLNGGQGREPEELEGVGPLIAVAVGLLTLLILAVIFIVKALL
jgi:hypothetical protein